MSPLTRAYLAFSAVSGPLWQVAMRRRVARGKEDAGRVEEKFGKGYAPRPDGEVLWFHALSVGEVLALVPLIERALAERPRSHVVLTTSTATSVEALGRMGLPDRAIHVLLPVDAAGPVGKFLDHWAPSVAVIAELDFWPRLLIETARREVPLILVNARIYEGSFESRARLGGLMRDVLGLFDAILVQDETSATRFVALGAEAGRIEVAGALKAAAKPLPADADQLARLRADFRDRPVWLAAATEASEHDAMIAAHELVIAGRPDACLVVAPRHVRDGAQLGELAEARGMKHSLRSAGASPKAEDAVYIADTIGEMGLWYRIARVAFVGHSLPGHGLTGKNPFEAAALGCAILTGPDVADFSESFEALGAAGATKVVRDAEGLADEVSRLIDGPEGEAMVEAARRVVDDKRGVLDRTWSVIASRLTGQARQG